MPRLSPDYNLAVTDKDVAAEWDYKTNEAKGLGTPEDYTRGSGKEVWWKCPKKGCGHPWEAAVYSRTSGRGCPACAGHVATSKNSLAALCKDLVAEWDYKTNEAKGLGTPEDYTLGARKEVWWKCPKKGCGYPWEAKIYHRTSGSGCPACAGHVATSKNSLAALCKDLVAEWDYKTNEAKGLGTPEDYTRGSEKKASWICSKKGCGHSWEAMILNRTSGSGCPECHRRKMTRRRDRRWSRIAKKEGKNYEEAVVVDLLRAVSTPHRD